MDLIEQFELIDHQTLREFIKQGQEEHLQLEFKTVANASLTAGDDKKTSPRRVLDLLTQVEDSLFGVL